MSVYSLRRFLEPVAQYGAEPLKAFAIEALAKLDEVSSEALAERERRRNKSATDPPRGDHEKPTRDPTRVASVGGSCGGFGGDLSEDPQKEREDKRDPPATSETRVKSAGDSGALQLEPPTPKTGKRATRCPPSTDPSALAWARMHGIPPPTPGTEAAKFMDYWASRNGRDALSPDWPAKWRSRPEWTKGGNGKGNGHWPEEQPSNAERGAAARDANARRAIEGR